MTKVRKFLLDLMKEYNAKSRTDIYAHAGYCQASMLLEFEDDLSIDYLRDQYTEKKRLHLAIADADHRDISRKRNNVKCEVLMRVADFMKENEINN